MEGIVAASVKPMEKIEGIKILHVDGMGNGEGSGKNMTDEVIDSALRYRVQAPMVFRARSKGLLGKGEFTGSAPCGRGRGTARWKPPPG